TCATARPVAKAATVSRCKTVLVVMWWEFVSDMLTVFQRPMKLLSVLTLTAIAGLAIAANTEWAVNGGDPGSSKYSPLAIINISNVKGLRLAGQWKSGESPMKEAAVFPGQFEATPLMIGDTLYFSTPYNRVVAVDAATGQEKWKYDPRAFDDGQPPNGTG